MLLIFQSQNYILFNENCVLKQVFLMFRYLSNRFFELMQGKGSIINLNNIRKN